MHDFVRAPSDCLRKLAPDEWIRAALGELVRAKEAVALGGARAALAGCKRAAGIAWVVRRHEAREDSGPKDSTERGEHDPG